MYLKLFILGLLFILYVTTSYSQIQPVPLPQIRQYTPLNINNTHTTTNSQQIIRNNTSLGNDPTQKVKDNAAKIMNAPVIPTQADIQKNIALQQQIVYSQTKFEEQRKELDEILRNVDTNFTNYILPNISSEFTNAYTSIASMLEGRTPLSLKRAVYLVENTHINNALTFAEFSQKIDEMGKEVLEKLMKEGFNKDDQVALNWALRKYFRENFTYDFEDFLGDNNWENMFVSKLIATNSGQCHSLPLLYLLLAESIGAKAWLALSPNHSYIKFQDYDGKFVNYETTNGYLTSDAWVMESGFIQAKAIQSKIYMDTLSKRQVIAQCLNDLAMGYEHKFGNSDPRFLLSCTNKALGEFPKKNNITAWQIQFNIAVGIFQAGMNRYKTNNPAQLMQIPEYSEMYGNIVGLDNIIKGLGFQGMPKEAYEAWLQSAEKEKLRQENLEIDYFPNITIDLD
jgi:hypothetical protein